MYELVVKNESEQSGSFCVFQTSPEQEKDKNIYSLAWFSKGVHSGTSAKFEWAIDYSFIWSETGYIVPGVRFSASEVKDANPSDKNENTTAFSHDNSGYFFKDTPKHGIEGGLTIRVDDTVPNHAASIGIGMGGKPALAVSAGMNMTYTFQPHPTYWIVFGDFKPGEVLDLNVASSSYKIVFPTNIYERNITFTKDNTWK